MYIYLSKYTYIHLSKYMFIDMHRVATCPSFCQMEDSGCGFSALDQF